MERRGGQSNLVESRLAQKIKKEYRLFKFSSTSGDNQPGKASRVPAKILRRYHRGSESTLVMLLLTIVTNIKTLHVNVELSLLPFRWRMAELLRNHQYMPKLHHYYCEEIGPESASKSKAITSIPDILHATFQANQPDRHKPANPGKGKNKQQGKRGNISRPNPARFPEINKASDLNTIQIDAPLHHTPSLHALFSARSNLQAVNFSLSNKSGNHWNIPFSTIEFLRALDPISSTLQSLTLSFPPRLLSFYKVDEDEFPTQSLKRFTNLEYLQLPIDALLGSDPSDAYKLWPLLPRALKELHLKDWSLRRRRSHAAEWTSERFLRAISDGVEKLPKDFRDLRAITIEFLDEPHFHQLQHTISEVSDSRICLYYLERREEAPYEEPPYEEPPYVGFGVIPEDFTITRSELEELRAEQLYWSQSS